MASRQTLKPGPQAVTWDGRVGKRPIRAGTYVLRVIATNGVGSMDLKKPFRVRR